MVCCNNQAGLRVGSACAHVHVRPCASQAARAIACGGRCGDHECCCLWNLLQCSSRRMAVHACVHAGPSPQAQSLWHCVCMAGRALSRRWQTHPVPSHCAIPFKTHSVSGAMPWPPCVCVCCVVYMGEGMRAVMRVRSMHALCSRARDCMCVWADLGGCQFTPPHALTSSCQRRRVAVSTAGVPAAGGDWARGALHAAAGSRA